MPAADDWQTWFDQHGSALVLLARQFVSSRADAEDIVQEAFVRFWRSRERVTDPAAFVFTCVRRCALDWQRTRRRQDKRDEQAARPESMFVTPGEQDERLGAIEAALRELPLEQAEVVVMKIWGRLSFLQVANALDLSVNTAASRYRYAIEKLRKMLAEELSYE
jgi:RNA polymerase sigma-70 factor, ECF subfamily